MLCFPWKLCILLHHNSEYLTCSATIVMQITILILKILIKSDTAALQRSFRHFFSIFNILSLYKRKRCWYLKPDNSTVNCYDSGKSCWDRLCLLGCNKDSIRPTSPTQSSLYQQIMLFNTTTQQQQLIFSFQILLDLLSRRRSIFNLLYK